MLIVIVCERAGDVDDFLRECSSQLEEGEFAKREKQRSERARQIFDHGIDCMHVLRYVRKSVDPPISHHTRVETGDIHVIRICYRRKRRNMH